MRVLCSTTPMDGVFGPFIPLGHALVHAGHQVVVASGANLRSRVQENGLEFAQAGLPAMDGVIAALADPEVKAAPAGDRVRFPAAMFGAVHPGAKLQPLRDLNESCPFDLIVHPPVDVSGPLLAAELDLPSVCYGFGQPFDPAVLAAMAERSRSLWEAAELQPDPYAGIYRGVYLDPRPPLLRGPETTPAADGTRPIRPEIPGDPAATLPAWADALGRRPVVYVSLGTAPLFNQPEKFTPLLAGLSGEAVEVVVTVGRPERPGGTWRVASDGARREVAGAVPAAGALRCRALPRRLGHDSRRACRRAAARAGPPRRRPVRQRSRLRTGRRGTSPDARPGHPSGRARRRSNRAAATIRPSAPLHEPSPPRSPPCHRQPTSSTS